MIPKLNGKNNIYLKEQLKMDMRGEGINSEIFGNIIAAALIMSIQPIITEAIIKGLVAPIKKENNN